MYAYMYVSLRYVYAGLCTFLLPDLEGETDKPFLIKFGQFRS